MLFLEVRDGLATTSCHESNCTTNPRIAVGEKSTTVADTTEVQGESGFGLVVEIGCVVTVVPLHVVGIDLA